MFQAVEWHTVLYFLALWVPVILPFSPKLHTVFPGVAQNPGVSRDVTDIPLQCRRRAALKSFGDCFSNGADGDSSQTSYDVWKLLENRNSREALARFEQSPE